MTKETRANLWFLLVFVTLALPGGVILFMKKLDPQARPMFMPDAVHQSLVYMDPLPAPPTMPRIVPPKTGRWVEELARGRGVAQVMMNQGLPVMSRERNFQVILANGRGVLLVWNPEWTEGFEIRGGTIERVEKILVPTEVMREIQAKGYPKPPANVVWIECKTPANTPPTPLVLSGRGAAGRAEDSATNFPGDVSRQD